MNRTFGWLGDVVGPDVESSLVTDMLITPTRTILNLTAGPVNITLTFLSPIEVRSSPRFPICVFIELITTMI